MQVRGQKSGRMFITRDQAKLGGAPFVTFKVYRSPQDKKTVFGYHEFNYRASENSVTSSRPNFGVPVEQAFESARRYAEERGISAIWINDPDRLFGIALSE
jgi:hypothetical protein